MKVKFKSDSYITNDYANAGSKRVQLISNQRICTMEEVDRYFGDVINEYNKHGETNKIKSIITNAKDKLWQILKRK